jgi:FAD binding domain-containing protein
MIMETGAGRRLDEIAGLPPVPTWWRGRVVLLGDAAHATSPSSGQGASLANRKCGIARVIRDLTFPIVLRTFYRPERMLGRIHRYTISFGAE